MEVEQLLAQAVMDERITYPQAYHIYQEIGRFLVMTEWQVE